MSDWLKDIEAVNGRVAPTRQQVQQLVDEVRRLREKVRTLEVENELRDIAEFEAKSREAILVVK